MIGEHLPELGIERLIIGLAEIEPQLAALLLEKLAQHLGQRHVVARGEHADLLQGAHADRRMHRQPLAVGQRFNDQGLTPLGQDAIKSGTSGHRDDLAQVHGWAPGMARRCQS